MFDIFLVYIGNFIPAKLHSETMPQKNYLTVDGKISIEYEYYIFLLYKFR